MSCQHALANYHKHQIANGHYRRYQCKEEKLIYYQDHCTDHSYKQEICATQEERRFLKKNFQHNKKGNHNPTSTEITSKKTMDPPTPQQTNQQL